jgi:hypothetical protein
VGGYRYDADHEGPAGVCLTLGSTMRPRLPTSLCFSTFCSRNRRFLSALAPCNPTHMFVHQNHIRVSEHPRSTRMTHRTRTRASVRHTRTSILLLDSDVRLSLFGANARTQIGIDLVLASDAKLRMHAPAAYLKPLRGGGECRPAEHQQARALSVAPPPPLPVREAAPLMNWTWRAGSGPAAGCSATRIPSRLLTA